MKRIIYFVAILVHIILCGQSSIAGEFITRWDMSLSGSSANQIIFEVGTSGSVNYAWETVPAGISFSGTFLGPIVTISGLPAGATIRLKIDSANFHQFRINNLSDGYRLIDVEQWGSIQWSSMNSAFRGCTNLNFTATDIPDLSNITDMYACFAGCQIFNSPINNWNVSNVINMDRMFDHAVNFNQPIDNWNVTNVASMNSMFTWALNFNQPLGNWNVSNVNNMSYMFSNAQDFNQPIGNWDVSNVTNMMHMFDQAYNFNQPIGNWNVSNVSNMAGMFSNASTFNQPIGNWNVGNVNNMGGMFSGATMFNQPIGNWNVGSVTNMSYMFRGTVAFNQPIGNWDVSNVTDMSNMFNGSIVFNQLIGSWDVSNVNNMMRMFSNAIAFNQPIGNWDVRNVTDMMEMFGQAYNFNQPIGNWDVGDVINMQFMFRNATAFNQPIGNWDVSNVTFMESMFENALSFNQPLGNWNVSNASFMKRMFFQASNFNQSLGNWILHSNTYLNFMLHNSGLDCSNYSQTIHGWANNPSCPNNRNLGALGLQYGTNLVADRNLLVNIKGWTIIGDTMSAGNCCLPTFSVNNQTACNSYLFNGQWLTTSGVYFDTLINSSGCDSNVTFNLTIGNPTASTINQTTCNSYIFNGQLFTASGIYYDTLINSNGCDSILTLNLTITQIDKTVVKNGFSFWSNQPGGSSYQWINCDNNIPIVGATNQGYTTIAGGSYAVIISYNGCIDTSNCITMIGLGTMSDQTSETSISMLPNPARDRLTVRHSKDGSLIMNIYDLSGRFVYQQTIPLGKMEMNIDISSLNGGHYFVKFIMNGKTVSINKLSVSR